MNQADHKLNAPRLGAHTSISGGLENAIYSGKEIGCDVVQIFSKNQMQWKAAPLQPQAAERFRHAVAETGVEAPMVHDSYLINLASPDDAVREKSAAAFREELRRCAMLQIPCLVMHPGSHMGAGEEKGLARIAEQIRQAVDDGAAENVTILLETTAGQGSNLGHTFEQIQSIRQQTGLGDRIGACLDTCHIFAAGYDLRTPEAWSATKAEFNRVIGLRHLKAIHLNDSKREPGSRIDRHERIGQGQIGLEGFRALMNDPDLRNVPMILEVPGNLPGYRDDLVLLRSLIKSS